MSEGHDSDTETAPPHAQLVQMAMAHWVSRIVYVAAKLGLADRLAEGPKSADELAGPTGTHAPSLYRLMRTLANLGILTESDTHRFALTPLGEALEAGAPGSARASVLTIASDWWVRGFGELLYSHDDARRTRRAGANGTRIRCAARQSGFPPHPSRAHQITSERRRSRYRLT